MVYYLFCFILCLMFNINYKTVVLKQTKTHYFFNKFYIVVVQLTRVRVIYIIRMIKNYQFF